MAAKKLRAEAATKRHAAQATAPPPSSPNVASDGEPVISPPPNSRSTQGASRWQLVVSAVLVALWIIFLAWMAFAG